MGSADNSELIQWVSWTSNTEHLVISFLSIPWSSVNISLGIKLFLLNGQFTLMHIPFSSEEIYFHLCVPTPRILDVLASIALCLCGILHKNLRFSFTIHKHSFCGPNPTHWKIVHKKALGYFGQKLLFWDLFFLHHTLTQWSQSCTRDPNTHFKIFLKYMLLKKTFLFKFFSHEYTL